MITKFIRDNVILIGIVVLGIFLRVDRINQLMPFIGDQGWFYLSARDIFLNHQIPLVGITSSHTWLHQGPLWTYLLAIVLPLFGFNPVAGAYLSILLDVLSIVLIYRIGSEFFSKRYGFIAGVLYATSPLIVINARLAYHTSLIPFLVLLFIYSLLQITHNKNKFIPISFLSISLLYNSELATVIFIPIYFVFLVYGAYKKETWIALFKNKQIITLSILALLLPMIPILIYDVGHGFPQTIKYAGWFVYHLFGFVGLYKTGETSDTAYGVMRFLLERYKLLSFAQDVRVSSILLLVSLFSIVTYGIKQIARPVGIVFLVTVVPLFAFILSKTASEAYLPMLFPGLILSLAFMFDTLIESGSGGIVLLFLLFTVIGNITFIYSNNYLVEMKGGFGLSMTKRIEASKKIIKLADGKSFKLEFQGPGSQFKSSTMNYEYLVWWLSKKSPSNNAKNIIQISEYQNDISVINLSSK